MRTTRLLTYKDVSGSRDRVGEVIAELVDSRAAVPTQASPGDADITRPPSTGTHRGTTFYAPFQPLSTAPQTLFGERLEQPTSRQAILPHRK